MAVEISVEKINLGEGHWRFDLKGNNLPGNLLGIAADMEFSGDWKNFTLEKWNFGNSWGESKGFEPIVLVKPAVDEKKIVFGITQKVNQMSKVQNGTILSLEFSGKGDLNFDKFRNQVLSVFEGKRVDLTNVFWRDGQSEIISTVSKDLTVSLGVSKDQKLSRSDLEKPDLKKTNEDVVGQIPGSEDVKAEENSLSVSDWQTSLMQDKIQEDNRTPNVQFLYWSIIIVGAVLIILLIVKVIWKHDGRL